MFETARRHLYKRISTTSIERGSVPETFRAEPDLRGATENASLGNILQAIRSGLGVAGRDIVLLVGRTGAGKSLLAGALAGYTPIKKILHESKLYSPPQWKAFLNESHDKSKDAIIVYDIEAPLAPVVGHKKVSETTRIQIQELKNGTLIVDVQGFFDNRDDIGGLATYLAFKSAKSVKIVVCENIETNLLESSRMDVSIYQELFKTLLNHTSGSEIMTDYMKSILFIGSHMKKMTHDDLKKRLGTSFNEHTQSTRSGATYKLSSHDILEFILRRDEDGDLYTLPFYPEDPASIAAIRDKIDALTPLDIDRSTAKIPLPAHVLDQIQSTLGVDSMSLLDAGIAAQEKRNSAKAAFEKVAAERQSCQSSWRKLQLEIDEFTLKMDKLLVGGTIENDMAALEKDIEKIEDEIKKSPGEFPENLDRLSQALLFSVMNDQRRAEENVLHANQEKQRRLADSLGTRDSLLGRITKLERELQTVHLPLCATLTADMQEADAVVEKIHLEIQLKAMPFYQFLTIVPDWVSGFPPNSPIVRFKEKCETYQAFFEAAPGADALKTKQALHRMVSQKECPPQDHLDYVIRLYSHDLFLSKGGVTGVDSLLIALIQIGFSQFDFVPMMASVFTQLIEGIDLVASEPQLLFDQLRLSLDQSCDSMDVYDLARKAIDLFQTQTRYLLPPIAILDEKKWKWIPVTGQLHDPLMVTVSRGNTDQYQVVLGETSPGDTGQNSLLSLVSEMSESNEFEKIKLRWLGDQSIRSSADVDRLLADLSGCRSVTEIKDLTRADQTCPGLLFLCEWESRGRCVPKSVQSEFVYQLSKYVLAAYDKVLIRLAEEIQRKVDDDACKLEACESKFQALQARLRADEDTLNRLQKMDGFRTDPQMLKLVQDIKSSIDRRAIKLWDNLKQYATWTTLEAAAQGVKLKITGVRGEEYQTCLLETIKHHARNFAEEPTCVLIEDGAVFYVQSSYALRVSSVIGDAEKARLAFTPSASNPVFKLCIHAPFVYLDTDLIFPSTTIEITAKVLRLDKGDHSVVIDTSGTSVPAPIFPEYPPRGINQKDGAHGVNGRNGHSAGNIVLVVEDAPDLDRIEFILKGSDGTMGQPGQPGQKGDSVKNGDNGDIDTLLAQLGIGDRFWKFFAWKWAFKADGQNPTMQATKGGNGGSNGVGGKGGAKGFCVVLVNKIPVIPKKLVSTPGKYGGDAAPGVGGAGGSMGKRGLDVGKEREYFNGTVPKTGGILKVENDSGRVLFGAKIVVVQTEDECAAQEKTHLESGEKGQLASLAIAEQVALPYQVDITQLTQVCNLETPSQNVGLQYTQQITNLVHQIGQLNRRATQKTTEISQAKNDLEETQEQLSEIRKEIDEMAKVRQKYGQKSLQKQLTHAFIRTIPAKVKKTDDTPYLKGVLNWGTGKVTSMTSAVTSFFDFSLPEYEVLRRDWVHYINAIDHHFELAGQKIDKDPELRSRLDKIVSKYAEFLINSLDSNPEKIAEDWAKYYQPFLEKLPGFCKLICHLELKSRDAILKTLFKLHVCDQENKFDSLFETFADLFDGLPDNEEQRQLKTRLMNAVYDSHSTRFVSSLTGHQKLIRDLIQNITIFGHIQSKEIDKYHEYQRLRPKVSLLGLETAQVDLSKEKKTLFNGTDLVSALVGLIPQDPNAVNQISSQLHHFRWAIEDLDSLRLLLYDLSSDGDSLVQPLRSRVDQLITEQYFSGLIKKIQTYSRVDVTSLFVLLQDPHLNLTDQCRAVTCLEKALKQNKRLSETEIHTCFLNELMKMEDEDIQGDPKVSQYNGAQLNDKLQLMMAMSEILEALTWRPKLNFLRKAALLFNASTILTAEELAHYEKELTLYEYPV